MDRGQTQLVNAGVGKPVRGIGGSDDDLTAFPTNLVIMSDYVTGGVARVRHFIPELLDNIPKDLVASSITRLTSMASPVHTRQRSPGMGIQSLVRMGTQGHPIPRSLR
jgi:hypothetical protein